MPDKYAVPFKVRLGQRGGCFHDMQSGLHLSHDDVATVKVMTQHTRAWLLAGGLVKVEGEAPAKKPIEKPAADVGASPSDSGIPEDDAGETIAENANQLQEGAGASLDDLLNDDDSAPTAAVPLSSISMVTKGKGKR